MIKIYEDTLSYRVTSENDDLSSNGMLDDEYIDKRIYFYDECYKLLHGLKRNNNKHHDLGIIECEYPYYFEYVQKDRINGNKYGDLYIVNLFGTEYKLIYVQNESDCFILENIDIAQDFADDLEKFTEKCNIYCEDLGAGLPDIKTLDANIYPYGISSDMKTIFNHKNTKAYLFKEDDITFIYELNTDTKNGLLYLYDNNVKDFLEWCNNIDTLLF